MQGQCKSVLIEESESLQFCRWRPRTFRQTGRRRTESARGDWGSSATHEVKVELQRNLIYMDFLRNELHSALEQRLLSVA